MKTYKSILAGHALVNAEYFKCIRHVQARFMTASSSQLHSSPTTRARTISYSLPFTPRYKEVTSLCCKNKFRTQCLFIHKEHNYKFCVKLQTTLNFIVKVHSFIYFSFEFVKQLTLTENLHDIAARSSQLYSSPTATTRTIAHSSPITPRFK